MKLTFFTFLLYLKIVHLDQVTKLQTFTSSPSMGLVKNTHEGIAASQISQMPLQNP